MQSGMSYPHSGGHCLNGLGIVMKDQRKPKVTSGERLRRNAVSRLI